MGINITKFLDLTPNDYIHIIRFKIYEIHIFNSKIKLKIATNSNTVNVIRIRRFAI